MPSPATTSTRPTVEVDVLILGAGIQGTWILNELRNDDRFANRGIVLLDINRAAGGMTAHSQALLHQGFAYTQLPNGEKPDQFKNLIALFKAVQGEWTVHIDRGSAIGQSKSKSNQSEAPATFYVSATQEKHTAREAFWTLQGLTPKLTPLPFGDPVRAKYCWESGETSLAPTQLVANLLQDHQGTLSKISSIKDCRVTEQNVELDIRLANNSEIAIKCHCLIMATGVQTRDLWKTPGFNGLPELPTSIPQKTTKSRWKFLILKAPSNLLPFLNVSSPDDARMMIISRRHQHDIVWIVTRRNEPAANRDLRDQILNSLPIRIATEDGWDRNWISNVLADLCKLFPSIQSNVKGMQICYHETIEPQKPDEFVEALVAGQPATVGPAGATERIIVANAGRLTLAPWKSRIVVEHIFRLIDGTPPTGTTGAWQQIQSDLPVSPEIWGEPDVSWYSLNF